MVFLVVLIDYFFFQIKLEKNKKSLFYSSFYLGIGIYFFKVFDIILIINKMFVFSIKVFLVYYLIEICLFFIFVYDFYDK